MHHLTKEDRKFTPKKSLNEVNVSCGSRTNDPNANCKTQTTLENEPDKQPSQTPARSKNPLRNLVGKLVFLDINNANKLSSRVRECLNLIEATIADCLSKDVDYVITNRENVTTSSSNGSQANETATCELSKKTKTSPNALHILSRSNSSINRAHAILEKASKGTSATDIIATARRLGINIINVSELERYIEKYVNKKRSLGADSHNSDDEAKKTLNTTNKDNSFNAGNSNNTSMSNNLPISNVSNLLTQSLPKRSLDKFSNHKVYKLKNPFLKSESICKQYKPIYQEFDKWHEINLDVLSNRCINSPFQVYFSDDNKSSDFSSSDEDGEPRSNNETAVSSKTNQSKQQQQQQQQSAAGIFKSPTSSTTVLNTPNVLGGESANKTATNSCLNRKSESSMSKNLCGAGTGPGVAGKNPLVLNPTGKRKITGYCECCKQRYDNLKQHLTSAQHENFERNQSNFKEIDEYVNGILNFKNFLVKKQLIEVNMQIESIEQSVQQQQAMSTDESEMQKPPEAPVPDNLKQLKEFAIMFNSKRRNLGISQSQVVEALNNLNDPSIGEATIERLERLDITPRSAAKMKPVLERLINSRELKFGNRLNSAQISSIENQQYSQNVDPVLNEKKRKRMLTFSSQTLDILNEALRKNPQPTDNEMNELAVKTNHEFESIRIWFAEKQSVLTTTTTTTTTNSSVKPVLKKFRKGAYLPKSVTLNLLENTSMNSSLLEEQSSPSASNNPQPKHTQVTPVKAPTECMSLSYAKKTTSSNAAAAAIASPLSLSSPSAAVLFGLQSCNSFSIPSEVPGNLPLNTSTHNTSAARLLASKIEFINGSSELQPIISSNNHNVSRDETSTDLSCIDDVVVAAFINDFSYEIVQK